MVSSSQITLAYVELTKTTKPPQQQNQKKKTKGLLDPIAQEL